MRAPTATTETSPRVPAALLSAALVLGMWLFPALVVAASVAGLLPERAAGPLSLGSIAGFAGAALLCTRVFYPDPD